MSSVLAKSWTISACLSNVDIVCAQLAAWLKEQDLSMDLFAWELLAREALNNAILHGCKLDPALHVCCELQYTEMALKLKIQDEGIGFDWRSHLEKEIADEDLENGRGIPLYRLYADSVEFNLCGNQVLLTRLLKR